MSRLQEMKHTQPRGPKKKRNLSSKAGLLHTGATGVSSSGSTTQTGLLIRNLPLFGREVRTKVTYYSASTITSGASSAGAYVFSANGLFDPDITSTGGQPMGFDQAMLFFNHYTVHKSTCQVLMMNNSSSLRANAALLVSGTSTVTTSIENAVENGDIQFWKLSFAGSARDTAKLSRTLDVGQFQSVDDVMDDPNMRGDAASNPAEQAYYHLTVWNPASVATLSCDFEVVITYDVTFHEPKKGPLS